MDKGSKVKFGYEVEEILERGVDPERSSVRGGTRVLIASLQLGLGV